MIRETLDFLKMNDVKYKENFPLSLISPVKIGGEATILVYPKTQDELIEIVDFLGKTKIKHKIVGRMSNVLPPDDKYSGIIIRTDFISRYHIKGTSVEASAGVSLPYLAKITADSGLSGLEELSGIPGSIGGAIRGNAGAFGREISQLVSRITVYDTKTSSFDRLKAEKVCFDYRSSSLMAENLVILSVKLSLSRSDKSKTNYLIQRYREKRIATQPVGQASLGSVFKRPYRDVSAAKLIDECGLKGKKVGGAKISEKHAGFIVNVGGATAADYLTLVEYAKDKVYEKFGILIEREIEVI